VFRRLRSMFISTNEIYVTGTFRGPGDLALQIIEDARSHLPFNAIRASVFHQINLPLL